MNIIAIIPARGGSKGLPRKNIKPVAGKPLIAYSIKAAKNCSLVSRVILSTDDEEIAQIGKEWGAEGAMIELQKQVGELAKYIMTAEKYYPEKKFEKDHKYAYDTLNANIGDELADILYAIIRIAKNYNINLEEAHIKAREAESKFLKSKGV